MLTDRSMSVCAVGFLCVCICVRARAHSQGGQGVKRVKGSGVHGGDLVVVQGQQSH